MPYLFEFVRRSVVRRFYFFDQRLQSSGPLLGRCTRHRGRDSRFVLSFLDVVHLYIEPIITWLSPDRFIVCQWRILRGVLGVQTSLSRYFSSCGYDVILFFFCLLNDVSGNMGIKPPQKLISINATVAVYNYDDARSKIQYVTVSTLFWREKYRESRKQTETECTRSVLNNAFSTCAWLTSTDSGEVVLLFGVPQNSSLDAS